MADNTKFQVRDTKEQLEKLDKALKIMDYRDRSDWYRDKKRELFREAERKESKDQQKWLWLDGTTGGFDDPRMYEVLEEPKLIK